MADPTVKGDLVNMEGVDDPDGIVGLEDQDRLQQYLSQPDENPLTDQQLANADINDDGVVDTTDDELLGNIIDKVQTPGNINLDTNGQLDFLDLWRLSAFLHDPVSYPLVHDFAQSNADINDDGVIDELDLQLLTTMVNSDEHKPSDVTLWGDVNCDGKVTPEDVQLINEFLAGVSTVTEQGIRNGDVDRDGELTWTDATYIMQYAMFTGQYQTPGDINCDGVVDHRDLDLLYAILQDTPSINYTGSFDSIEGIRLDGLYNADINLDEKLDESDLQSLISLVTPEITWVVKPPQVMTVFTENDVTVTVSIKNHFSFSQVTFNRDGLETPISLDLSEDVITASWTITPEQDKDYSYEICVINSGNKQTTEPGSFQINIVDVSDTEPTVIGDVNGDGFITQEDYDLLQQYMNDPENTEISNQGLVNADINGDGVLDEQDLNLLNLKITNPWTTLDVSLYGDVNEDNVVNVEDVVLLNSYLSEGHGLTDQGKANSDVDLDSELTADDMDLIVTSIQGKHNLPKQD